MSLKIISGYASKLANTLCSPDISSILTSNKETKDGSLPHFLWKPIVEANSISNIRYRRSYTLSEAC